MSERREQGGRQIRRPGVIARGWWFCLLAAAALVWSSEAQGEPQPGGWDRAAEIGFTRLGLADGLPHDSESALAQDRDGFLWFGTLSGLARYDGHTMKVYRRDPRSTESIPDNYIRALLGGADGTLWIGTNNGGLAMLDIESGKIRRLPVDGAGIDHARVFALAGDGGNGVWAATLTALDHLDPTGRVIERVAAGPDVPGFPQGHLYSVMRDHKGGLWVGGDGGLAHRVAGSAAWQRIAADDPPAGTTVNGAVWAVREAEDGRIWVGADRLGLAVIEPETGHAHSLPQLTGAGSAIGTATVRDFVMAPGGRIWAVTFGNGVFVVDAATGQFQHLLAQVGDTVGLAGNDLRAGLSDRGGLIWLATDHGIQRHNPLNRGLVSVLPRNSDGSLLGDVSVGLVEADQILIGLAGGRIAALDPTDGHTIRVIDLAADGPRPRAVFQMVAAGDGTLWVGADALWRVDPTTGAAHLVKPDGVGTNIISLHCDGQDLWIGTYHGAYRFEPGSGRVTRFHFSPDDPRSLSDDLARGFLRDRGGHFWIATASGLNLMQADGGFRHFRHEDTNPASLPHDYVGTMALDARGRLVVGTVGGGVGIAERIEADGTPVFRTIDSTDGLPSDLISGIATDADGRLWIATSAGLASIDPQTFAVHRLGREGLQHPRGFHTGGASPRLPDGTLLFGGDGGLILVRPDEIANWRYPAPLEITGLRIDSQPVELGRATALTIPANSRKLELVFSLLDYSVNGAVQYGYRLDGLDPGWTEGGPDQRRATYTNLAPGRYRLELQARARPDLPPVERVLAITVLPAWYQSWWSRGLAVLLAIAAIAAIVRLRTAMLHRRQRQLEQIIATRTAELDHSLSEARAASEALKRAQTRLVQQEKMASLGQLTAGIAHEIKNPLNFIKNFSMVASDLLGELTDELAAGGPPPEDLIQMLNGNLASIRRHGDRLDGIVSGMVLHARGGGEVQDIEINKLLDDAANLTLHRVKSGPAGAVPIQRALDGSAGAVRAVPQDLMRAFVNLLGNAVYAVERRRSGAAGVYDPEVRIATRDRGDTVEVVIEDNGVGIPPAARAKLFTPFFTTKPSGEGVGLGLSMTWDIVVSQHGGQITVESEEDLYTRFTLTLPRRGS